MTENEAIKILISEKHCLDKPTKGLCKINCGDCKENISIAYQEKAYEMAISALKEIQQYREIGTVEECREAVERQTQKKCAIDSCPDHTHYKCPSCGQIELSIYKHGFPRLGRITKYCENCGQALQQEDI